MKTRYKQLPSVLIRGEVTEVFVRPRRDRSGKHEAILLSPLFDYLGGHREQLARIYADSVKDAEVAIRAFSGTKPS